MMFKTDVISIAQSPSVRNSQKDDTIFKYIHNSITVMRATHDNPINKFSAARRLIAKNKNKKLYFLLYM